jgi:hypothetical protein
MLSANRDSLSSSFLICIPFNSSSCIIALARHFKILLNVHGGEHSYLVPYVRGIVFSFSPFCVTLALDLLYITFIM